MDALLLALVLVFAVDQGAAPQRAMTIGSIARPLVLGMAVLPVAISACLGAAIGGWLSSDARLLFLALTLILAAIGLLAGSRRPPPDGPLRLLVARFGENAPLVAGGIAAFTLAPVTTITGGIAGTAAALVPAATLGRQLVDGPLLRILRLVIAILLAIAGFIMAVTALALI